MKDVPIYEGLLALSRFGATAMEIIAYLAAAAIITLVVVLLWRFETRGSYEDQNW